MDKAFLLKINLYKQIIVYNLLNYIYTYLSTFANKHELLFFILNYI